jgi:hypothetical protein
MKSSLRSEAFQLVSISALRRWKLFGRLAQTRITKPGYALHDIT